MSVPLERIADGGGLALLHVGYFRGDARVVFTANGKDEPAYAIELEGVASVFDDLRRGAEVRVVTGKPGSAGWRLAPDEALRQVQVTGVGRGAGRLVALARSVRYRTATEDDRN